MKKKQLQRLQILKSQIIMNEHDVTNAKEFLESLNQRLNSLPNESIGSATIRLEPDYSYVSYGGSDGYSRELLLSWFETESDEAFAKREATYLETLEKLKEEKKAAKAAKDERDRKEYERLQKKFGSKK